MEIEKLTSKLIKLSELSDGIDEESFYSKIDKIKEVFEEKLKKKEITPATSVSVESKIKLIFRKENSLKAGTEIERVLISEFEKIFKKFSKKKVREDITIESVGKNHQNYQGDMIIFYKKDDINHCLRVELKSGVRHGTGVWALSNCTKSHNFDVYISCHKKKDSLHYNLFKKSYIDQRFGINCKDRFTAKFDNISLPYYYPCNKYAKPENLIETHTTFKEFAAYLYSLL